MNQLFFFRIPRRGILVFFGLALCLGSSFAIGSVEEDDGQARAAIQRAIDAMGGEAYQNVTGTTSSGRYFRFRKGRKAFARYQDWTLYDPVKWRFQLGEGKRQQVQIYNLEAGKGWTLEGKDTVEEVPEDAIAEFRRSVKQDIDYILKKRLGEEGLSLFYYGPNDVAGEGRFEAVEVIDATNDAVILFFDIDSHLPAKAESHFVDKMGVRHKQEVELSNWHEIDGVRFPLRHDVYVDEELSSQRFLEELTANPPMDPSLFSEPVIEED